MHKFKPSSSIGESPWASRLKRGVAITAGFFALSIMLTSPDGEPNNSQSAIEVLDSSASPDRQSHLASNLDFSYSLSVDCSVAQGGRSQPGWFSWSNDTHRPLGIALSKNGAGSNPYFFIGQRAPGANENDSPERGWVVGYDTAAKKYVVYDYHTEDMPVDGSENGETAPHIVTVQKQAFDLGAIMKMVSLQTPDGMQLKIEHDSSMPDKPLLFKLSCPSPKAPS